MPKSPSFAPSQKDSLSRLRLLFIYHPINDNTKARLAANALTDLRICLGSRTCYALTAPRVAGAICQTNMFDYRDATTTATERQSEKDSHFGPPVTSVEILLKGNEEKEHGKAGVGASEPEGKVVVRGPAVCGGERGELELEGVKGKVGGDGTVRLV